MTASAMTFDSLVTDIETYCERSDQPFLDQVPRFIMMAENRIASEKKPLGLQRTVTSVFSGSQLAKPVRWRLTRSLSYVNSTNQRIYLKNREYEFCRAYWPDDSLSGLPLFYADYSYEYFFFAPTPNAAYAIEVNYFERPEPLATDNQTNWTTQYAPQLILYASLIEAMPFLKTSERIPEFVELYKQAMAAITQEDTERVTDATVVRTK